jgi:hypothetical protein
MQAMGLQTQNGRRQKMAGLFTVAVDVYSHAYRVFDRFSHLTEFSFIKTF